MWVKPGDELEGGGIRYFKNSRDCGGCGTGSRVSGFRGFQVYTQAFCGGLMGGTM